MAQIKLVVQGYFNYYAVPGNLESLAVFRDRLLGLWWRTLRRRSPQRHLPWTRMLALGRRWLPPPHVAYKAERGGNELFWSPWTMYPRSQERRRNREATVYLPA